MKTATFLTRALHFIIGVMLTFGRVEAKLQNTSEIDAFYQHMLQEYQNMLSGIEGGHIRRSCINACDESVENKQRSADECQCDRHCVEFRDCCLDYWQSCNASFNDAFNKTQLYECTEPELKLSNRTRAKKIERRGYQVVAKCPVAFQDPELKKKCENPEDDEPSPFVEGVDARSYKNEHCARCHFIRKWKVWNTSLSCPESTMDLVRERLSRKDYNFNSTEREAVRTTCEVKMSAPNTSKPFACKIVKECEDRSSPDYLKCVVYKRHLYNSYKPVIYRNPHCAKCSKTYLGLLSLQKSHIHKGDPGNTNSLAILFDFSIASLIYGSKGIQSTSSCPKDALYDLELKRCRKQRIQSDFNPTQNWTCPYDNETFPNSSAYIITYKNSSIFVRAHVRIYEKNDYLWRGNNITVCGNFTRDFLHFTESTEAELYSRAEFFLTVVGYTLSILSLFLVLLTYSLFGELRTLPGKITMNLATALLLSQAVFLVDMSEELSPQSCKAVAVLLHYLYLASFSWMSVLACDVAKTFASKGKTKASYSSSSFFTQGRRSQTHAQQRAFCACCLYAWGSPLILISIALGVDSAGAMNVGYGNVQYCWITNPWALAIFFVGPVIAMLVFNTIALIVVLALIRRERRVTKKAIDRSTTKQDFGICWKLTAVFGLTWMLGLGAPYHTAVRIAFILCNSLQGFSLMAGFIMTRRILNLYLRMTGMQPLTSRTAPTRSTIISSRSLRRRRSSASAAKVWAKPKPSMKQDVLEKLEKPNTVKKDVEVAQITEIRAFETDV